jgi:glycosyl transferase family 25
MQTWLDSTVALVICLAGNERRLAHAESLLRSLPIPGQVITAVDGHWLDTGIVKSRVRRQIFSPRYPFRLTLAEMGCFLSHRAAWQALLDSGARHAIVLQDGAVLSQDFEATVGRLFSQQGEWSFIQLHSHRPVEGEGPLLARRPVPQAGTVGQLLSRQAAASLLGMSERFDRPVDSFLQLQWATGVPVHYLPQPIVTNVGGCVGTSATDKRRLSITEKLRRTFVRPIYQTSLHLRAREALG